MAEDIVTPQRLDAGRDYLASLMELGLRPDALLWTIAANRDEGTDLRLTLVSNLVERFGPAQIYSLLYSSYDLAGTPKAINPWIVSLYGPKSAFAEQFAKAPGIADIDVLGTAASGEAVSMGKPWQLVSDRMFQPGWIYLRKYQKPDVMRDLRAMERFRANVQALAA